MIILQGKKYKSISDAARKHNLTVSCLHYRICKHGKDYEYLFDQVLPNKNQIILLGKKYSSISAAAREHGMTFDLLWDRIKKHGTNYKYLFAKKIAKKAPILRPVILNGTKYDSISEAARLHNIKPHTLWTRIKRYGKNSPKLFNNAISSKKDVNRPKQFNNTKSSKKDKSKLHNCEKEFDSTLFELIYPQQASALKIAYTKRKQLHMQAICDVHKQNCVTLSDVEKQCNVLITDLQIDMNHVLRGGHATSGFYRSDLIPFKNYHKYGGTIAPKWVLKKEAIDHINAFQSRIKNTVVIPFTNNRYFYSANDNTIYSKMTNKNKILFHKCKPRFNPKYPNMSPRYLIYLKPYKTVDISLNTVQDIIKNTNITYDTLISKAELIKAYGPNLSKKLVLGELHTRFDDDGHIKKGYAKGEIKFK